MPQNNFPVDNETPEILLSKMLALLGCSRNDALEKLQTEIKYSNNVRKTRRDVRAAMMQLENLIVGATAEDRLDDLLSGLRGVVLTSEQADHAIAIIQECRGPGL